MAAGMESVSGRLSVRILREVVEPFMREHADGKHGPRDPAACQTEILCGLALAIVPVLVQSSEIATQRKLIAVLVEMIEQEAAAFRGHQLLKSVGATQ